MISGLLKKWVPLFLCVLMAQLGHAQTAYTLNHGFGGATGLPAGISIVSYDGATACATTSNGANAVTTLVLAAQPGFNFTVTSVNGTGVRSNAGSANFNFRVINNGMVNGAVTAVAASSSCAGGTAISTLNVPAANQTVFSGGTISISIPRSPGSTSGGGYSHVKTLVIQGQVFVAPPVATAATALTTLGFTANWNAVPGATGYRLDVSDSADFATVLEDYDNIAVAGLTWYVHLGIVPNTTYYYRVRAEIADQVSGNSNIITAVVPACGIIALPAATAQMFCGPATIAALSATGDGAIAWYSTETSVQALAATEALATGTYYVSQTIANCTSERVAVAVTVNEIPLAPVTVTGQNFCGQGTVAGLQATGTNLLWYTTATGGTALTADTALTTGTYYASQTVNGCESPRSATLATIIAIPAAPVAAAQQFCGAAQASQLTVTTGTAPLWYSAETGGDALVSTTALATGTYYVSQTVNGCESSRTAVAVTVNGIPAAPVATAQQFCGAGQVAQLTVTTGTAPLWYTAETGGEALLPVTALATGTYYVSQTVNGCESPRTPVVVTVYDIPALPQIATQVFCGSGTVAQLSATQASAPQWYTALLGGEPLSNDTALATGIYYVSQTVNGCEGPRAAFIVLINDVPAAPLAAAQTFCGATTAAQLTANGTGIVWYGTQDSVTPLTADTALATGTYYAAQTINNCESLRTAVTVTVNAIPAAPAAQALTFCGQATAAQLTAQGTGIVWYATETAGSAITANEAVHTGTYYASQTVNGCESPRTAVAVTVTTTPVAPAADADVVSFCNTATIANLTASGENIAWYATATGGDALAADTAIGAGISVYYASQTVNGCESTDRTAVAVNLTRAITPVGEATQQYTAGDTLASLTVTGENIVWYSDAALTAMVEANTELEDEATYYAVSVVGDCTSTALAVTVQEALGTAVNTKTEVTFYPNPVLSDLHITAQVPVTGVVVYNIMGQEVAKAATTGTDVTVPMQAIAAGTYLVKATTANGSKIIKVIRN